jgi:hypothetical protein
MELRRVDPRTLKKNPGNPRKIQPGEMSDAAMKASIKVIGASSRQPSPKKTALSPSSTATVVCVSPSNSD